MPQQMVVAILHRWQEFHDLYKKLKKVYPDAKLKLPGKKIWENNFDPEFIRARMEGLDHFISKIIKVQSGWEGGASQMRGAGGQGELGQIEGSEWAEGGSQIEGSGWSCPNVFMCRFIVSLKGGRLECICILLNVNTSLYSRQCKD